MKLSYRYLPLEVALNEISAVRAGKIDVIANLGKEDFHLRPFTDQGVSQERLIEIRANFFALLGVKTGDVLDIPSKTAKTDFDSIFTKNSQLLLHDLNPIDGFSKDVWSYLTLRVLPDFALWRWPDNAEERFLGGAERSAFQRLWQRAYILGPDLASDLQEDEAVNIFERPEALGGNKRLSKFFAEYIVKNRGVTGGKSGEKIISTKIVKQAAKRLRRTMSVQVVQTMSDNELSAHIANTFKDAFGYENSK